MQIGVIQFPGSNCERETKLAIKRAGMTPVDFLWNQPRDQLRQMDGFVIVGGFSYEDRSRAGIIAALDPLMQAIKVESEAGKPILGICNGAQILVETGLVPGLENHKVGMVLTENKRVLDGKLLGTGFYNAWIHMRVANDYQRNAFTRHLTPRHVLHVPVAHAEGRFVMSPALLQEIQAQGLNVFQYCDAEGFVDKNFPVNPNGSMDNIAAIANKQGNVLAMMPHPERTPNGDAIFTSMRDYIETRTQDRHENVPLYYYPRRNNLAHYQKAASTVELLVELIITDNQARTVQSTLEELGMNVRVKCLRHWEIDCDRLDLLHEIKNSEVLFNARKEREVKTKAKGILVRPKDDIVGAEKCQMLKNHFYLQGVNYIRSGLVWYFESPAGTIAHDQILSTNIIHNPYAHDCYQYSN